MSGLRRARRPSTAPGPRIRCSALRAPFTIFPPKPSAAYYALSANDSGVQRSMLVEPDGMAVPKAGAGRKRVREKAATHVHLNIIADYRSQKLLVLHG